MNFNKNGCINCDFLVEPTELSDGSIWIPICQHLNNEGTQLFSSSTDFTKPVYQSNEVQCNFSLIGTVPRPDSAYYEILVIQQGSLNGTWSTYRFKQKVSPLTATYEDVNPGNSNVTCIQGGSSSYGGMYIIDGGNYMCFADGTKGDQFGCGARSNFSGGIPSIDCTVVKGWQLVYIRTTVVSANASSYKVFVNNIVEV